ncbi:MAG: glycoside hydrolase family 13 protein [Psychroflexus halocasei]|uniref:glycoside hydrolase family 13 protein n=1 Tax=Psychroflexus sp. S27 TaxID=1982757 RepID=UPI000C29DEE1|nr:glycoside hydrolase family 13 protein [Psychroflexus sp. S27]
MVTAQNLRVEPPHWFAGMKSQQLQLLVHAENIKDAEIKLNSDRVKLLQVHKADSPNYLFLDLELAQTSKAYSFKINFEFKNQKNLSYKYRIKKRLKAADNYEGFDSSDAIYLITPDRFANGNPSNDVIKGMNETKIDRADTYARHGGDIEGIIQHLNYISDMGFTAIWPSPLLENNMHYGSYHGYAMTDFYKVDPRFGDLKSYQKLADKLHQKDMKLIMDMVANHCGSEHWWMKDLPFEDWINYQEKYVNKNDIPLSNHRRTTNQDPYASDIDTDLNQKGWFVETMPDLNQKNPFMAKYIIQNSIWWIETLGLNGIRQDTYPYANKGFMSDWAKAIMTEYPNFNIVGEEWSTNPLLVGYWQDGANNKDKYESHLKSTMDFPMQTAIVNALNEDETWGTGLVKIYEALANDFYYNNPESIMLFADNHDMSRIYTQLNEDVSKTKMALGLVLSLPRIPQIYYGTEILLDDSENPGDHGLIRTDFPGGWKSDEVNAFKGEGLSNKQKDFQLFLKNLLNYRKNSKALTEGDTKHFAVFNAIYTLVRTTKDEKVILFLNKNKETQMIDLSRFEELDFNGKTFKSIIDSQRFKWNQTLDLKPGLSIFTTKK